MPAPVLSVVVPTRDRAALLERCLDALAAGRAGCGEPVEILVADDCSVDSTPDLLAARPDVLAIRLDQPSGSSAARNAALERISAPLVLFIDDDIVIGDGLLERHLEHHRDHAEVEAALVGLVTWSREKPITAHMRWLERGGPLFAFDTIADPDTVDPSHFCTANVSVKASLLDRVEGPFNPSLKRFTDVELGARLAEQGMRLRYDSEAVGWHLRHDTPRSTDDRMRVVGEASLELDRLHPGLAPPAGPDSTATMIKATIAKLVSPIAPLLPERTADRIWSARAAWAYAEGRRGAGG
ncbi:MAG: glycosyltransferase [Actinomycetes bacterium]